MTLPTTGRRYGWSALSTTAATLGFWYGLSGANAMILLELYRNGERGSRICELLELLETKAEPGIIKVYICHLRARLREAFDGEDVISTDWERAGPRGDCRLTRYRLHPRAIADVRECLEMAHEELSAVLGEKAVRVAA